MEASGGHEWLERRFNVEHLTGIEIKILPTDESYIISILSFSYSDIIDEYDSGVQYS